MITIIMVYRCTFVCHCCSQAHPRRDVGEGPAAPAWRRDFWTPGNDVKRTLPVLPGSVALILGHRQYGMGWTLLVQLVHPFSDHAFWVFFRKSLKPIWRPTSVLDLATFDFTCPSFWGWLYFQPKQFVVDSSWWTIIDNLCYTCIWLCFFRSLQLCFRPIVCCVEWKDIIN